MTNAIIPANLDTAAPAPLAPLEHVIINPANIEIEKRRKRAVKLTVWERWRKQRDLQAVEQELKRVQFDEVAAVYEALKERMELLAVLHDELKEQRAANPEDVEVQKKWRRLARKSVPLRQRWQAVNSHYKQIVPIFNRQQELKQSLENHDIAVARDKAEKKRFKLMTVEAKIYERLIIEKWTRLGYCHRYKEGEKNRIDRVSFSKVGISLDAIYFKIATSSQTAFKHWTTNIPDTVKVTTQLLTEETLDELSITCQRQVTGIHSPSGAWVIVHRLDSVDGLMNYVAYSDVMDRYPVSISHKVPICVGVGLNREVKWVNLADFHHWLIGGFTGSGKSNLVNVGICTMISQHKPDDLRLVLIDLKGGLEFSDYKGMPHLHGDIIDTVSGVADCLAEVEAIMKERFKKFRNVARNYEDYRVRRPNEHMPRLVVIFDEVASIMDNGETTKRILSSLRELTRQGRAVGINILLCTQRPDVEAIAGSVKANLNLRISGRMTTSQDSITVLGSSAAKELAAVAGRMVLQIGPDPEALQTPHITEDDILAAKKIALKYEAPAPLEIPVGARNAHRDWTPENIIEFSLKHMDGLLSGRRIFDALHDSNITAKQVYGLVEQVWAMENIVFEGQRYAVEKRRGSARYLVPITDTPQLQDKEGEDSQVHSFTDVSLYEPSHESSCEPLREPLFSPVLSTAPNYAEVEMRL